MCVSLKLLEGNCVGPDHRQLTLNSQGNLRHELPLSFPILIKSIWIIPIHYDSLVTRFFIKIYHTSRKSVLVYKGNVGNYSEQVLVNLVSPEKICFIHFSRH